MATAKKPVSKATNTKAKPAPTVKKAVAKAKEPVSKKAVAKKATAVKAATSSNKKAAPTKTVPAKKAAPLAKAAPVKKQNLTKVNDKTKKVAAKPAPVQKAAPAAKKAALAPKAAPAKSIAKAPVKKVAAPVAKAAPPKKVAAPVAKAVPAKPAPAKKAIPEVKAPAVKKPAEKAVSDKPRKAAKSLTKTAAQLMPSKPMPKPSPAPAAFIGREEKKANVIVAHRRLENKSKEEDDSGKTMINYKPEFTRSILSTQAEEKSGPIYRYSDEELNEFRELIQGRLEKARKELSYQQGLITRKDEAGTEDTENRYMNMEDGSGAMEREQLAQLASRQIQFINHLEKALIRIENKTYGICRVTGNLIDKNRLRAVPHATLSIEAKMQMNKR